LCLAAGTGRADDVQRIDGAAPANHEVLRHARGGAYFIAKGLKEEYDRLLGRVQALKADLAAERIEGVDARRILRGLQSQLDVLRKEIEDKKVLVLPVKVHTQSETTMYDLGPHRLLVITADNIRMEGWDGPQVKCVLEKTVLAADDKPVDDHLKGLKMIHRHGRAANLLGRTDAEILADEEQFLASSEGQNLNERSRKSRQALVRKIADGYSVYRDFQGREIDMLSIEGLTHDQGNRQIVVGIESPDGGGNLGSDWQRHAALTVYVPKCQAIALRGCLVGLDVSDIHANLVVSRADSQNRDYDGRFRIRELHGSLTVDNAPLDLIDSIHGNVTIASTTELANTGTQHEGGERTAYTPAPRQLTCQNIDGDLRAWFTRVDVRLSDIGGRIDVTNEFGETSFTATAALDDSPHRLIAQSGRIEAHLTRAAIGKLSVQGLTNCGNVRTNAGQDVLVNTNFTIGLGHDGTSRDWHGFRSKPADGRHVAADFDPIFRLDAVLTGADRTSGLDLISRGGTVVVTIDE
jgi:hypothetical protein